MDQLKKAEEEAKAGANRQQQIEELRIMLDEMKRQQEGEWRHWAGVPSRRRGWRPAAASLTESRTASLARIDFYGVPDEIRDQVAHSMPKLGMRNWTHEMREALSEALAKLPGMIQKFTITKWKARRLLSSRCRQHARPSALGSIGAILGKDSLGNRRRGVAPADQVPIGPRPGVEKSGRRCVEHRLKHSVTIMLPEAANLFERTIGHRLGDKSFGS